MDGVNLTPQGDIGRNGTGGAGQTEGLPHAEQRHRERDRVGGPAGVRPVPLAPHRPGGDAHQDAQDLPPVRPARGAP